jgi:hypothetical protein
VKEKRADYILAAGLRPALDKRINLSPVTGFSQDNHSAFIEGL